MRSEDLAQELLKFDDSLAPSVCMLGRCLSHGLRVPSDLAFDAVAELEELAYRYPDYGAIYDTLSRAIQEHSPVEQLQNPFMKSKFPGKCVICGGSIKPGEEIWYDGKASHAACKRGIGGGVSAAPVQPRVERPQVQERVVLEGADTVRIYFNYDPDKVAIVKSLLGARFDKDRDNTWTADASTCALPRLLEVSRKLNLEIDPRLEQKLAEGKQRVAAKTETTGLRPYQLEGVEFLNSCNAGILGDEMGLGKSVQTLAALPRDGSVPVLVICPAAVKINWQNEARRWAKAYVSIVLSGKGSFVCPKVGQIVIINYDILEDGVPPCLLPGTWLIADEAHRVKNYKSKRSARVNAMIKSILETGGKAFGLTGTPLANRPEDLWGVLSTFELSWKVFGTWERWLELMGGRKTRFGYDYGTPRPEAAYRLRRVMLRRLKKDVLPDLPAKQYQTLIVGKPSKKLSAELDKIWAKIEGDIQDGDLPEFSSMASVRAQLAEARIPELLDMVEDYEEAGTPIVVCSAHRLPIDTLGEREGWAVVTGSETAEQKAANVAKFQAGELKGIALTIRAGGIGITLTRASTMIFCDLDWSPSENAQAEDRIHRIGQNAESVNIIRLVTDHPLDIHVNELLVSKQEAIDIAVESEIAQFPKWEPEPGRPVWAPVTFQVTEDMLPTSGYAIPGESGKLVFYNVRHYAGSVYLILQAGPNRIPLGKVTADGIVMGDRPEVVKSIFERLMADPMGAASAYGLELGRCAVCGRELTDEESRRLGIGPTCREKFGR